MSNEQGRTIVEHLAAVQDPRVERTKFHPLINIFVITLCGVICGADDWVAIEEYGQSKQAWLGQFLDLSHGIPSHDTFGRVFAMLDPSEVQACFLGWVRSVAQVTQGEIVAIDGKQLCGSADEGKGKSAIRMVSAWACANRLVLAQRKVDEKSNEITAIPALLQLLDLHGCIVTIDAIGCQREIAQTIVDQGADYVLPLKGNQPALYEAVHEYFADLAAPQVRNVRYHKTIDKGHGRLEVRHHWLTDDVQWLTQVTGKALWPGLAAIGMIRAERQSKRGTTSHTRYYLTSLAPDVQTFAAAARSHWCIENQVHWVLDVAFYEDHNRTRTGHADENLAVIRHLALNLIKREVSVKLGVKNRRLKAAWNDAYLAQVLFT